MREGGEGRSEEVGMAVRMMGLKTSERERERGDGRGRERGDGRGRERGR